MKKVLVLVITICLLMQSTHAFVYAQGFNDDHYAQYDTPNNKLYSYNYREANKASDFYEDQFRFEEDRIYNKINQRSSFRTFKSYAKPVTKAFNPDKKNRFRD